MVRAVAEEVERSGNVLGYVLEVELSQFADGVEAGMREGQD